MKPHVFLAISPSEAMQFQIEMMLRSLETFGLCKKYYCTLFVPNDDLRRITNRFIMKRAEIIQYPVNRIYKDSWTPCPRWRRVPESDISLIIDPDVLVLNDINPFLQMCQDQQKLMGVIAKACPFNEPRNAIDIWRELFRICEVEFPKESYAHRDNNIWCPYYINHGVIAMPSDHLTKTAGVIDPILERLNTKIHDNRYIAQIATAIAFAKLKLPCLAVDLKYNRLGNDKWQDDTVFYHCLSKFSTMKEMRTLLPVVIGKIKLDRLTTIKI